MISQSAGAQSPCFVRGCAFVFRAAFCPSLLTAATVFAAEAARAPSAPEQDKVIAMQDFVVTGSHIRRLDL
ncbi:MAG: hypothetical protein FJ399_12375, partial [Verrucomicrobia bacterium]|nr:hypothetical protein [Verrucomicrobiota bacterium]